MLQSLGSLSSTTLDFKLRMNSFPAQRLPDLWHHGGGAYRGSGGREGLLVREPGHDFRLRRLHRTHDVQCQNRTVGIVIQDISLKTLPFTNRSVSNPGFFPDFRQAKIARIKIR